MELEPRSLNIPLQRRDHCCTATIAACALVIGLLWLFGSPFALFFAASAVVATPIIWVFLLPPITVRTLADKLGAPQFVGYLLCFGYIALAKGVLVPLVARLLQKVAGTS